MPQLVDLLPQRVPLAEEHLQPGLDGVVPLLGQLDIVPNVPDGHAGLFHAVDDLQPLHIRVLKHPDAAGGALHEGQQPLLVVVAQGGGGHLQPFCDLAHGIDHKIASKNERVLLT